MSWLRATYLTVVSFINFLFAIALLASAYAYTIPPEKLLFASYLGLVFPVFLTINLLFVIFWIIQRHYTALISIIAIIACWQSVWNYVPLHAGTDESVRKTFTLLTYNVHNFNNYTPHTPDSPNPIISYIQNDGADIICMQEFSFGNSKNLISLEQINSALSEYPYKHFTLGSKTPYSQSGIACYSKYPFQEITDIKYDSSYNGSCVYKIKINGHILTLINNHLESNKFTSNDRKFYTYMMKHIDDTELFPEFKDRLISKMGTAFRKRALQADSIARTIQKNDSNIIVCGDFNDTPQSYAYRKVRGNLNDAYVSTGFGPGITYYANKFWFRIDHILYGSGLQPVSTLIDKIKLSDHYPVRAIFQWNETSCQNGKEI
ncbi:endonuclease/exonuclease/phosphatase family protein [Coprobacter sp.]